MYADNTSLAYSAKDVKNITSTMNAELEILRYGYTVISYL